MIKEIVYRPEKDKVFTAADIFNIITSDSFNIHSHCLVVETISEFTILVCPYISKDFLLGELDYLNSDKILIDIDTITKIVVRPVY